MRHSVQWALLAWVAGLMLCGAFPSSGAETRLGSPQKHFDVIFRPIEPEQAKKIAAVRDAHGPARTQYRVEFWMSGSSTTVNRYDSVDADPPPLPADILSGMIWSPDENFVVVPAMKQTQQNGHALYDLVTLDGSDRVLEFQADHLHWIDKTRLVGDVNTKQAPGGIVVLDAPRHDAHLVLAPMTGIGYQLVSGTHSGVVVKEFVNDRPADKTSWETFTPACLTLDLDTLKKRSTPCP